MTTDNSQSSTESVTASITAQSIIEFANANDIVLARGSFIVQQDTVLKACVVGVVAYMLGFKGTSGSFVYILRKLPRNFVCGLSTGFEEPKADVSDTSGDFKRGFEIGKEVAGHIDAYMA
jgi:hypothetical protein